MELLSLRYAVILHLNKQPKYPKNMRLVDPQSWVWMIGRRDKILPLSGMEPQFTGYQTGILVTISTELTRKIPVARYNYTENQAKENERNCNEC
jgi:hypothetical protein